jgi:tight adherence protein B
MSLLILFAVLLVLCFGVLLFFMRPTAAETAVTEHLKDLASSRVVSADPASILKKEGFSSIPWLDELIAQLPGSYPLQRLLHQSGKTWPVGAVQLCSVASAVVGAWLTSVFVPSILLDVCMGLVLGLAPVLTLYILRAIRFRKFDTLLPEAVDLMSRGLRAGHAVSAALEMVGREIGDPVGSEFRVLHEEQTLGLPMREAMENLVERVPLDDVRFLATALLLQKETGGNLVQILDKTAALIRERSRLRGQVSIYTAQGRITGWILCLMPFLMFGILSLVNHQYESLLFTAPMGRYMVCGGLVMMVIGIAIIRKVIDIKA